MKKSNLTEAVSVGTLVIQSFLRNSENSGLLTYYAGQLLAMLPAQIAGATIAPNMVQLFETARLTGATYTQIDLIRTTAAALSPKGPQGIALQAFAIQLCLVEMVQILAATVFVTRADIDAALDAINAAFDAAVEIASNAFDQVAYQFLISLHAACAQDLSSRAQTLPRMLTFNFQKPVNSLWLAQYLYQDASRADELVAENNVQHPCFMPSPILALSS